MFEIVKLFPEVSISNQLIPLMPNKNGELLMIINYQRIVSYNPQTAEYKSIIPCICFVTYSSDVFVESLISPTGYNWNKKQHQCFKQSIIWSVNYLQRLCRGAVTRVVNLGKRSS